MKTCNYKRHVYLLITYSVVKTVLKNCQILNALKIIEANTIISQTVHLRVKKTGVRKHIESFQPVESHNCGKDSAKISSSRLICHQNV